AKSEKGRSLDAGQALGAIGDGGGIAQNDRNDLAEAEGDNREIIAAKTKRRRAEQDAETGAQQRRDRQHDPVRKMELGDVPVTEPDLCYLAQPLEGHPED